MIEIQALQVVEPATQADLGSVSALYANGILSSATVYINLKTEAGEIVKRVLVELTLEEYQSWGAGPEGDTALLDLCLTKAQIAKM